MMNFCCRFRGTLPIVCWLLAAGTASGLDPSQVSRTAISVACSRAFMARADDPAVKNPDYLAERLLDDELKSLVEGCAGLDRPYAEAAPELLTGPAAMITLGMVVRTRHIDGALQEALMDGVQQVVILGAGLDTRAYRFHEAYPAARFFEVDSPATQADKKERIERVFGGTPEHVVFVPVDFETQSVAEELAAAGFDEGTRTFYVWEGVSMYLTAEAIDATFEFVKSHSAPGSEIVFDYAYKELIDGTFPEPPPMRQRRLARLNQWGEPWLFGIPQGRTREFLEERGMETVSDFPVGELFVKYLGPEVTARIPTRNEALAMAVARVPE